VQTDKVMGFKLAFVCAVLFFCVYLVVKKFLVLHE
jgi:hypothetical protein